MPQDARPGRLEAIDLARGGALVAMAVYHFAWDLEFFGYAPAGMTSQGFWALFARAIASSFLFLVGVSLFLAHAKGVRWRPFLRRLAMVAAAAAAITLVTLVATPDGFIFFGILHQIALASLIGLAFLRLPAALTLAAAVAAVTAPLWLRSALFDHPALWWVGLSSRNPRSNDYVPLMPWFGAVLTGIAAARIAAAAGLFERIGRLSPHRATRPLQAAGRHSLAVYLLHQPVLIGGLWLFSLAVPPAQEPADIRFTRACAVQCTQTYAAEYCSLYCVCVVDRLVEEGLFEEVYEDRQSVPTQQRLQEIVGTCSFEAEFFDTGEERP